MKKRAVSKRQSRNPFVNQVFVVRSNPLPEAADQRARSQSLRKSGLCRQSSKTTNATTGNCRNPFVNQVFVVTIS